jgi:hypothetical protein
MNTPLGVGFESPLSRAEHRRCGRKTRVGLFERSEFRRATSALTTHRRKRGTGGFFWLLFLTLRKITALQMLILDRQ